METIFNGYYAQNTEQFKSYYVVWKPICGLDIGLRADSLNRTMQYGNNNGSSNDILESNRLNRTMQYGNSFLLTSVQMHVFCLNRTMQYGNHKSDNPDNCDDRQFKSYYVVWKQVLRRNNHGRNMKFKSYYVVWKLCIILIKYFKLTSLNRTMQYGNKFG